MSAGAASAAAWREALALGERLGLLPPEVVAAALEELAGRPDGELTPALVAFWVDLPEATVAELLRSSAGVSGATVLTGAATLMGGGPARGATPGSADVAPRLEPGALVLEPGATLGDFVLGAPLGAGGMGRVFRARQLSLARDVALKVLSPELAVDPEGQRRFLREGRALAAIAHPRVVTCYQAGTSREGLHFIAMELMTGGDASALMKQAPGGKLGERRALELTRDAAEALVAFEAAGLVHRDLKPHNLFLTAEGRAKLGDLGLARSSAGSDRMTLTGVAVGTLPFMAPEQLAGSADLDIRTDVYALGATLFCFLTGRAPAVHSGPPKLDASPRTTAFVRRAMALEPARRYPSARAALDAVLEALASVKATERGPSARSQAPRGKLVAPVVAPVGARIATTRSTAPAKRSDPRKRIVVPALLVGAVLLGAALAFGLKPDADRPAGPLARSDSTGDPTRDAIDPASETALGDVPLDPADRAGPSPLGEVRPHQEPASDEPHSDDHPSEAQRAGEEPPSATPARSAQDLEPAAPDEPLRATPPPSRPSPEPAPAQPEAERVLPLAGLPIHPAGQGLEEVSPGVYRSRPDPGAEWQRAAAFDAERRALPLRVRWTLTAAATRDSGALQPWERAHGFLEPAGFFFELGLRADDTRITAARELGPAWWLSLSVQRSGRVLGLVRQINRRRPGGTDLVAVPQPGLPRVPGVDIVGRFDFQGEPGAELELDLDADEEGWRLRAVHAGRQVADLARRWGDSRHAPITDELRDGVHLWTHLGNYAGGAGTGSFRVGLRPE